MAGQWMTSAQVCEVLVIAPRSLSRMVRLGNLKRYKLGKRNRYLRADVEAMIVPDGVDCTQSEWQLFGKTITNTNPEPVEGSDTTEGGAA